MMWYVKSYAQLCPLARALDVVGDRWALLVVRELSLGGRRYTDLAAGLPGIGTNVLAARLTELQAAGVITKHSLPPPTAVTVYELTDAGRGLGPALAALTAWGAEHGRPPAPGDVGRASWLLRRLRGRPTALRADTECELHVAGEVFSLRGGQNGLLIEARAAQEPGAAIHLGLGTLAALLRTAAPTRAATPDVAVTGDQGIAQQAMETLAGALGTMA
jgi:DNA-binding HxlR family transcriptional regulator